MIQSRQTQGQLESLLISVLIHAAIIFLVPYVAPAPTVDVYPLDVAGVIEISAIETEPASPAPAPGLNVKEVAPTPASEPPKAAPTKKKEDPKPAVAPAPAAKPQPQPAAEPKPVGKTEPKVPTPAVDKPEVVSSPAGKSVAPASEPEPVPAAAPAQVPEPNSTLGKDVESPTASARSYTETKPASGSGTVGGTGEKPPTAGDPGGTGVVPRPEYPGDDRTGYGMISSTGGAGHGVVIPKGVQNIKGRGEAKVRIRVTSDGKVDSVSFLIPPPDKAMEKPIRNAIMGEWVFKPDTTLGREDAYYLDVWISYDGGTEDISVESERVSYKR